VLLVEDDRDVREAVAQLLEDEGFQVVTAEGGRAALEELGGGGHRFCTILLDLVMPGMDGVEFLRRARDRLGETPVLLFSASPLCHQLREHPQVKDVIPKPVEIEVLLEKIRAHCGAGTAGEPPGSPDRSSAA